MNKFIQLSKAFSADRSGAVAVVFGLSLMALFFFMGFAIDSSRLLSAKTSVQTALDVAALAGAKMLDSSATDAEVKARTKKFFDAQLPQLKIHGLKLTNFDAKPDRNNSSVTAAVDVKLPTIFGKLANIKPTIDFRPSSEVIYKAKKLELALSLDITGSMCMGCDKIATLKTAAKDMVDALFSSSPEPGAVRVALVPWSASINLGSYFGSATKGWHSDTCVVERGGSKAYTDDAPGWSSNFGTSSISSNPRYSCPSAELAPLTDLSDGTARSAFKSKIDGLTPVGATAGHIGAAWGWYTLSPQWRSFWPSANAPRPYSDDVIKVVVLMTDGNFNVSYNNGGEKLNPPASEDPKIMGSSANQALKICDAIKATGNIRIYAVAFQAPVLAKSVLEQCAGAPNFYDATNNAQLLQSFKEIVDKLTNMRITS